MHKFDIFRLNCFLDDREASNFKKIIISLSCEFLYAFDNKEVELKDIYSYVNNDMKINVEYDYFCEAIKNSKNFEMSQVDSDIILKLTTEKYSQIYERIKEHSIETYVREFVEKRGYENNIQQAILEILYHSIYENINSFAIDNIRSILPHNIQEKHSQSEIDAFNAFLEDSAYEKNTALYNVFLKAIEFAIITSGKGIKEFSKDIFSGKTYLLDANIIFRLLGIGGDERKDSLIKLIKSCKTQGVNFEYSAQTLQELNRKLEQSVKNFQSAEQKGQIAILGELASQNQTIFNNGFVLHYSLLRKSGIVKNPSMYELKLKSDFRNLCTTLGITLSDGRVRIDSSEKSKLSSKLIKEKKEINEYNRYAASAADVDAHNILYVRAKRGHNNYNFSDVKSFYLSTDRTLNTILGKSDRVNIPETILPSQLFILHHPISETSEGVDYELFLQFLKRRTTEFKYTGKDVLNFIDQVRQYSNNDGTIKNVILEYSDYRFKVSNDKTSTEQTIMPFREYQETFFDRTSGELEATKNKYNEILANSDQQLLKKYALSRNIVRLIDVIITLIIVPVFGLLFKKWIPDFLSLSILIVLLEILKFAITTKTPALGRLWKKILSVILKSSPYFTLTNDDDYIERGIDMIIEQNGDVWKRKMSK